MANENDKHVPNAEVVESRGPKPFVTRRVHRAADGSLQVWSARHHRKGLVAPELARVMSLGERVRGCLFEPGELNWWIGIIFAVGASLFAVASVFVLAPQLAARMAMTSTSPNVVYFAGSITFTVAAYLQLFQAANADKLSSGRAILVGWRPGDLGWLSCLLQFLGTLLFNLNTFDAMIPSLTWFDQDLLVWVPDFVGSVLFLASGYLAFIEASHAYWSWQDRSISWWVVFINLLGCLGFMVAAVLSIVLPNDTNNTMTTIAVAFTLQGAICFLVGALLTLPELTMKE